MWNWTLNGHTHTHRWILGPSVCLSVPSGWRTTLLRLLQVCCCGPSKGKSSPYSIIERRVLELIPVLGSQPAGAVSYKPSGRLPLLSARPAVTLVTLKRAATNSAAWWTEARWVWAVCLRLLPDSVCTFYLELSTCTHSFYRHPIHL